LKKAKEMSAPESVDENLGKRKSRGARRIGAEEKKKKEDEHISKYPKMTAFFNSIQPKG